MSSTFGVLEQLALSSYGPGARFKAVVASDDGSGDTVVTTSAQRLFSLASLQLGDHPAARVLVDLVASQARACGDAGLFAIGFSARLVQLHHNDALSTVPRHTVLRGLELALRWALQYARGEGCTANICWAELDGVRAVVRTVLGSKPVTRLRGRRLDFATALVLEAFLCSLPGLNDGGEEGKSECGAEGSAAAVRITTSVGRDVLQSCVLRDAVLLPARAIPHAVRQLLPMRGVRVALFDVSLMPPTCASVLQPSHEPPANMSTPLPAPAPVPSRTTPASKELTHDALAGGAQPLGNDASAASPQPLPPPKASSQSWSVASTEEAWLTAMKDELVRSGARVVASQRLVHPTLKASLGRRGVLVLERLSLRHIAAVQAVTGAQLIHTLGLSSWQGTDTGAGAIAGAASGAAVQRQGGWLDSSALGMLGSITSWSEAGTLFLRLQASEGQPLGENDSDEYSSCSDDEGDGERQGHCACDGGDAFSACDGVWRERRRPVVTLLLCAPDELAVDETKVAVESALRVLKRLLSDPTVFPGAGCIEAHLACALRARARGLGDDNGDDAGGVGGSGGGGGGGINCDGNDGGHSRCTGNSGGRSGHAAVTRRHLQAVVEHFASCLEAVGPTTLARNGGSRFLSQEIVSQLHKANCVSMDAAATAAAANGGGCGPAYAKPLHFWGWDVENNCPQEVLVASRRSVDGQLLTTRAHVLESAAAKLQALETAVETAVTVLRVRTDQVRR